MMRGLKVMGIALLFLPAVLQAGDDGRGWWLAERFQGTSNDAGLVLKANSTVGYTFNGHIQMYSGLPVYFTQASSNDTATSGTASPTGFVNGIGNAFAGLLITASNSSLKYSSDLMVTAPTGDRTNGFSTGHASLDWTNTFSHSFEALTPYASVGLANTVSDTAFFVRPFITNGAVAHFEGGSIFRIAPHVGVGASAYGIQATGQQEIVSKVLRKSATQSSTTLSTTTSTTTKNGSTTSTVTTTTPSTSSKKNLFQTTPQTTTTADAADDHGFSAWLSLRPNSKTDFQIGYSHSVAYQLDSLSFGVGFRVGQ
jgi:hypothetical protein